jgi:glycosyltransferase involved in cell wall biosynthesis
VLERIFRDVMELQSSKHKTPTEDIENSKSSDNTKSTIVIDGRVFSTDAHDRGMGRYVKFLIQTIVRAGYEICLILYKGSRFKKNDPVLILCKNFEHIDIHPEEFDEEDIHDCSYAIEVILSNNKAAVFVDATPFLFPMRFDITECPVIALAYDLIPLRHPSKYNLHTPSASTELYENALRRLIKADCLITISNYSKEVISQYLGIDKNRIQVIYPCLEEEYLHEPSTEYKSLDFFAILGSHFSKNPQFALELFKELRDVKKFTYKISVSTAEQLSILKEEYPSLTKGLSIKASIGEREKVFAQAHSKVVFHLSCDEGFGIPLLEALFKCTRVFCCDIRINHEILEKSGGKIEKIAYLVAAQTRKNDLAEISDFIDSPEDPETLVLFNNIRNSFISHWTIEAPKVLKGAIKIACEEHRGFSKGIVAKMVSNTPGDFCGVADYAYSIPLGTEKNMLIYTTDISGRKMHALENVRLKSHLCFLRDLKHPTATIFHLAISERLWFGVELLRLYGSSKDAAIIHDHIYLHGLYDLYYHHNKINDFLNNYFVDCDSDLKINIAREKYISFEDFKSATARYSSAWLRRTKVKLISHLTEAAESELKQLSHTNIPSDKQFVDMGIEDRISRIALRTRTIWRAQNNITALDLLVGVFGSVTSNKWISEIASAVSKAAEELQKTSTQNQVRMHFIICGKIHEREIFDKAETCFKSNGLNTLFHYENPINDQIFDGLLTASDIVILCRKQDRGQLSHILPRSLSLGRLLLTNSSSGYRMISSDCIFDDLDFENNLIEKLCYFARNPEMLKAVSHFNRRLFLEEHLISHCFEKICLTTTPKKEPIHEIQ